MFCHDTYIRCCFFSLSGSIKLAAFVIPNLRVCFCYLDFESIIINHSTSLPGFSDKMSSSTKETKKNFLRQFRDESSLELKQLTATQFMEIWSHYDTDGKSELNLEATLDQLWPKSARILGNGFIEGSELDSFLAELTSSVNSTDCPSADVSPIWRLSSSSPISTSTFIISSSYRRAYSTSSSRPFSRPMKRTMMVSY